MSVRIATTANISLDNTTTTVDGVTLANGDLVLVKNQTTGTQNGIYVASTTGAWSRSSLLPSGISAYKKTFYVTSGTVNQNLNFTCPVTPAVVDTDSLVFMAYDNALLSNLSASVAPTVTDDNTKGYAVGSIWINTAGNAVYTCTNSGTGVAVWTQGGTGDVMGPASATDNAVTRFDGTTGKLIQDSSVTLSDTQGLAGVRTLSLTDATTNTLLLQPAPATTSYTLTLPAAQGAASTFLRNDGAGGLSWVAGNSGDVVGPASATDNAVTRFDGTTGKLIQDSSVTLSDTQGLAGVRTLSLTDATTNTLLLQPAPATTSYTLTLPAAQGAVNTILQNDGSGNLSWATGGGDVVGPASATNNAIARFDATTGKLIKNSTVTISDTADIAAAKTLAMDGSTSGTLTIRPAATTTSYTMTMPGAQGTANTYLLNDGSGGLSWAQGTSGNLLNVQTFISASGTFTYTPTLGTNRALVYVVGGGGAGGGAASGVNKSCGAGGAGGGCQVGLFAIDTALTGTVVIGAGGTGVSGTSGNNGGNSTFTFNGSTITGTGGTGGSAAQSANLLFITPPALATGSSTAINTVLLNTYTIFGSIPPRGEVYAATNTLYAGVGGNSAMGGGANTTGSSGGTGGTNGVAGKNGVGGGGSGAYQTNTTAFTGGAGGFGGVYVFEYTNNTVTTQLTTEYLMGNLTATVTTNITDGNHAPFNQAFQSSNGTANTGNIILDTSSTYSSATNTASIGRITLKVGSTYSLMGIIKSLGDVAYYGYSWFNSDTNVRIGTRGESFSATAQMANAASNPSYSTYTPSVDTRVELRLTESATGTIVNWYNGSGGFGETMFNISVVKVTNGQTVFGGSTSVSAGTQGLVPAPAAGQQNYMLMGGGTWGNGVYAQTTVQRNAETASTNNFFFNTTTDQLEYYDGSKYLTNSVVTITTTAQTGSLSDRLVIFSPPSSTALAYTLPDASVTHGTTIRYQISSAATAVNATVTLSPQVGQTVNGGANFTLAGRGDFVLLVSNGASWVVADKPTGMLLLYNAAMPSSATQIFDNVFNSKYSSYVIEFYVINAGGSGGITNIWGLRSGGAAINAANYYISGNYNGPFNGNINANNVTSWTGVNFCNWSGNNSDYISQTFEIVNPSSATQIKRFTGQSMYSLGGTATYTNVFSGAYKVAATTADGWYFTTDSGTVTGNVKIYARTSTV